MQRVAYSGENSRLSPLLSLSHSPEDVSRFFDTWAFTQCAIRNGSFFQSSYITTLSRSFA